MRITDWLSFTSVPQMSAETLNSQLGEDGHQLYLLDVDGHQLYLLDVRSHTEWKLSHIPLSHCVPVFNIDISQLPKDSTIICICLSAHRSTPIVRELLRHEYDAYELTGGMRQWWKHNLPTEKS